MPLTIDELVRTALATARKKFPRYVVDFRTLLGVDSTGDNAVWIWVILDDSTPEARRRHASLEPIAVQIRSAIQQTLGDASEFKLDVVPYVRFRLKSEQDEVDRAAKNA